VSNKYANFIVNFLHNVYICYKLFFRHISASKFTDLYSLCGNINWRDGFLQEFIIVIKISLWSSTQYHVEIKCQLDATDEFLLQILLLAQHVSGTFMPIIRSSRARKPDTQPSTPHCTDNLKTKHQIRQTATTCIIL
jgi:hypothetical protein